MINNDLLEKINYLDNELKNEVIDFIDFLIKKKTNNTKKKHPKAGFIKKNSIIIKDGFDEIPDCFKEYLN